jgi:hypothetical protein
MPNTETRKLVPNARRMNLSFAISNSLCLVIPSEARNFSFLHTPHVENLLFLAIVEVHRG